MPLVLDGSDGITQPSITTAFGLPAGTTAQRPTGVVGMIRFNTDLNALENFTADGWFRVSIPIPALTSVTGDITNGAASVLTLTGTNFGVGAGTVRFTSGATVENVAVTPASQTSATVTVPAAIFNLSAGTSVGVQFINEDNGVSNSVSKTVALPALITDFLVIAGGGGGGNALGTGTYASAGGGAGGYRTSAGTSGGGASAESSLTLTPATNYTVTVGAGGAVAFKASDSVFSTITSAGGGSGSPNNGASSRDGGSGGGAGDVEGTGGQSAGTGTANQGFGGGAAGASGTAGGGGGAGASGSNNVGGTGVASSITGSSTFRAGGGTGGTASTVAGGAGGGGTGGPFDTATAGGSNTGGGGGGTRGLNAANQSGKAGGSGVVIVKYPDAYTITNPGGGLTSSTASAGGFKVTTFTAGTGNIQFA